MSLRNLLTRKDSVYSDLHLPCRQLWQRNRHERIPHFLLIFHASSTKSRRPDPDPLVHQLPEIEIVHYATA